MHTKRVPHHLGSNPRGGACQSLIDRPFRTSPRSHIATTRSSRTLTACGPRKLGASCITLGSGVDSQAALDRYINVRDDLHAGRVPLANSDNATVRDLLNRFLTAKEHQRDTGEITRRTFNDYHNTCKRIAEVFGLSRLVNDLQPVDFEALRRQIAKRWGLLALGNEVGRTRVVFNFALESRLIESPMMFGAFKRPSKRALRKIRQAEPAKMFEAGEIRTLLGEANPIMQAMILLGINSGFGNHDVSALPKRVVDVDQRWLEFPRPKTGVERRCWLWDETASALRHAIDERPHAKSPEYESLAFLTKRGRPWGNGSDGNPLSSEFVKLQRRARVYRSGRGFYALRHSFRTIADGALDQVATDLIMGHARNDMGSVYRERIADDRLWRVVGHVHDWLFA